MFQRSRISPKASKKRNYGRGETESVKAHRKENIVWSPGFFLSTVEIDKKVIESYVKWQGKKDLAGDIRSGIRRLLHLRSTLSTSAQSRFRVGVHNAIPFGSAIIIDHDKPYGKIQIETKPYKAPYSKSFAFEVIPTKRGGYYDTLLSGYQTLIKDGESLSS